MSTLDERILKNKEHMEQLKRQRRTQKKREQEKQRAIDTRRRIIVGDLVIKYFPEVMRYQPHHNAVDNSAEFAPLDGFLSELAAHKEYVTMLIENHKGALTHRGV